MVVDRLIQSSELRAFAGHFATGVAVVTTSDASGACYGLTMNAVTSLSLDPPLLLICLAHSSSTLKALRQSGYFCLHFLSSEQQAISDLFSKKTDDKFSTLTFTRGDFGSPVLSGVIAASECEVTSTYPGGDHTIVIGAVKTVAAPGGTPLLYHRGRYTQLAEHKKIA
ncbi:MAG TPA: flavin reductase family protein [Xanthobacteraceae bacterium]|nr:flavin reductase family protein [Xanthobacteraceae bacterium]